MELWKIYTMLFYSRKSMFYGQLVSVIFAMSSFINGQNAQLERNINRFITWHNLWHTYPLLCILIQCYDYFILGEYEVDLSIPLPIENQRFLPTLSFIRDSRPIAPNFVTEILTRRRIQSDNTFTSSIADKKSQ